MTYFDRHADTCVVVENYIITHCNEINSQPKHVNDVDYDPTLGITRGMNIVNDVVTCDYSQ